MVAHGLRLGVLGLALAAVGCASDAGLPPLHPAKGTVTHGGKPLADALVRLRPEKDDPTLTIVATTDARGHFELSTQTTRGNVKRPGVPEGTYRVTIDLPIRDDQSGGGSVELAKPYTVRAGENTFTFEAAEKK